MERIGLNELTSIISAGENEQVEFKSRISNVEVAAKNIVAFANTNGGRLIVGYDERTKTIGSCSLKDRTMIERAISSIDNCPKVNLYTLNIDGKCVLILDVDKQEKGIAFWNGRMFSRDNERIISMGEKEIRHRMATVSNDFLLDAITKLSNQNQQLSDLIDKTSRSSTITSIITCVAGALLGTLFGFILNLFI